MVLSGAISAAEEVDRQLSSESFLPQDKQQRDLSPSQMSRHENVIAGDAGDETLKEDSPQQIEEKKLEVELRKLLLLSCPR
jgi:hypothetical protein